MIVDISFSEFVFSICRKFNIKQVYVSFDGSGDSGWVEPPAVIMKDGFNEPGSEQLEKIDSDVEKIFAKLDPHSEQFKFAFDGCEDYNEVITNIKDDLKKMQNEKFNRYAKSDDLSNKAVFFRLIANWVCNYLDTLYGGWENNDGMSGTFTWDTETDEGEFYRKIPITEYEEHTESI